MPAHHRRAGAGGGGQCAIKSGQVDLVLNVDPSVIGTLKDDPSVELLETGASNSMTVSMWVDTAPFDNVRVSQALKAVVDRQADDRYGAAGLRPAGRRQSGAAQEPGLLHHGSAEAGHREGQAAPRRGRASAMAEFDLYTAEGVPGMVRMAQVFAEMARPAGIDINVVVTPAESFWDDVWLKRPIVTSAWSMRPPGEGLGVAYTQTPSGRKPTGTVPTTTPCC
jgi:peptide/nickel transport system substrate-binding protein